MMKPYTKILIIQKHALRGDLKFIINLFGRVIKNETHFFVSKSL